MKRAVWIGGALAGLLVLVFGGLALKDYVILHIAGWRGPPVGENRPVVWEAGPETPAMAPADRPPNVIVILADDLGFNDISLNGGLGDGTVRTPHIDALARGGAILAEGYAGNATCSPSRAALMTGRYPTRFGFEFTSVPVQMARLLPTLSDRNEEFKLVFRSDRVDQVPPYEQMGVPASEITLAELMKARGYHTLHLGKWHLGETAGMRPEDQGFDESLGFMVGAQLFLPERDPNVVNSRQSFDPLDRFLWANLPYSVQYNGGQRFHPDRYMTDYLTDQALAGIRANRNRPFFMYLAYNAPHTPLQAGTGLCGDGRGPGPRRWPDHE
jgi:arylsulfatase A-like enzyme